MEIVYPVSRLLANPKLFNAITAYLDWPDTEVVRSSFYDLLEYGFNDLPSEDCEFDAEEACFSSENDGETFLIQLDNGVMSRMDVILENGASQISTRNEFMASSLLWQRIVSAIEKANPELQDEVVLCSPPTPGNDFLKVGEVSDEEDEFEGSFHLKSDPDKEYAFIVTLSEESDKATIKPM